MRVRLLASTDSPARARVTAVTMKRQSLQGADGAGAGDLAAVAPERHFLDEVGNRFAEGAEACLHVAVRCDVRHAAGKAQRLREAVVQIDFENALSARLGKGRRAAPDGTQRIESHA